MSTIPCYPNPLFPLNIYLSSLLAVSGYLQRCLAAPQNPARAGQEMAGLTHCTDCTDAARSHLLNFERLVRQALLPDQPILPLGQVSFQFMPGEMLHAYQQLRDEALEDNRRLVRAILASPQCCLPGPLKTECRQALTTIRQFSAASALAPTFGQRLDNLYNGFDSAVISLTLIRRHLEAGASKTGPP
jgi:hypothetical protein